MSTNENFGICSKKDLISANSAQNKCWVYMTKQIVIIAIKMVLWLLRGYSKF